MDIKIQLYSATKRVKNGYMNKQPMSRTEANREEDKKVYRKQLGTITTPNNEF